MRISTFWEFMDHEFGSGYSRVLARDLVVAELGNHTAVEALDAGVDPKRVWFAVCRAQEIPEERRWGPDREPKK